MSFFEKLEQLRAKPEDQRRRLTFWFSAGATALVAIIWVVSLSFTLKPSGVAQVAAVGASDVKEVATSSQESSSFLNDNKVKIIEGWKVITNQN